MFNHSWVKGLIFFGVFGFVLRLLGIGYGLPFLSHPDEARIILDTLSMGHRMSLLPQMPDYALLYRYLLLFLYGLYFLVGRMLHLFSSNVDFALKFLENPAPIYLISRFVSAVFGTIISIPAYFFGCRVFKSKEAGVIAALFVLCEFQLFQHSQWALYSIVLCFIVCLAFYYICSLVQNPSLRNFLLAGTCCGLAISVQNQGIYLLPSLFLSYLMVFLQTGEENKKQILVFLAWSVFLLSLFAFLGNFYWIFIFNKSWTRMVWMMDVTRVGFSSQAPYRYNLFDMFIWFTRELFRQDLLLGIISIAGIFYSLIRHKKEDILLIIFVVVHLGVNSQWGFRSLHDVISLLPVVCLVGARFLADVIKTVQNRMVYLLILLIAIIPLTMQEFVVDIKKMHKDTRVIAKEWVESNIPSGARIGIDWPSLSVPLLSDTPFLLRNPSSEIYYNAQLKPLIGKEYDAFIANKPHFKISELRYISDEPIWPSNMPEDVRIEAAKKPVCRDLYSRFVYKDMDTAINKDKDDYIIIDSYAWSMFLFDTDPFKRNLFKPFIKDHTEDVFRHSQSYINDKRHGYLFFLAQQGREFYLPLLSGHFNNVRLMKEFIPTNTNLGPEIMIFKVIRNGN